MTDPTIGIVISPSSSVVSPAELLKVFLDRYVDRELCPHGAVVGGAGDAEQQEGVLALMDAGNERNDDLLIRKRAQVRAMAGSLEHADRIGNWAEALLHRQKWLEITDARGDTWFVHWIRTAAGPSHHIDSKESWESLFIATLCIGRQPVPRVP